MRAPSTLVLAIVAVLAVVAALLVLRVDGAARSATVNIVDAGQSDSVPPIILPPRPIAGRTVVR